MKKVDKASKDLARQKATKSGVPIWLFAALAITFLSFFPALRNGFTNWDDNGYVFENAHLGRPLGEAVAYFFGPHYFIGNYIPLTMSLYSFVFHLAGLDAQSYHTLSLFLHLVNVSLVFWFIYLLSGKKREVAFFVALFFGIHPMHVESVAWIAELKDVLYTAFFFSGLIVYWNYLAKQRSPVKEHIGYYLAVLAFFILSLLSKPAAIIFPVVLLLIDYYAGRKSTTRLWIEKLPFFLLSVLFGFIAVRAQQADRLLHDYYPLSQRFFFAAHSLLVYFIKFLAPVGLALFHPYPRVTDGHLPVAYYAAPVVVLLLFYLVFKTVERTRLIAFGVLFFVVNLLLVLQLVSVGDAIVAERYTYVPYIGLLFVAGMLLYDVYDSNRKNIIIAMIAILATVCSYQTYSRCLVWENDITLADDLVEKYPDDRLALNNKGFIQKELHNYPEAISLLTKAIQIKPDYAMAYMNLVNCYIDLNDLNSAMRAADDAIAHVPDDYNVQNKKGFILFRMKRYSEAIPFFRKGKVLKADNPDSYIFIAECYAAMQDTKAQMDVLNEGLKVIPDECMLLNNKGYALFQLRRYDEAIEYFKAALKIKPDFQQASANLSECYKVMSSTTH